MINSEEFNGLDASEGFEGIIDKLEKEGEEREQLIIDLETG
ncbi:leucyl-tRNA synthetase domain protein [Clostridioides difficile DA00165]|nr:leucyl-tRNA synthetase domain protein [Clostridioides difficile DA00165]